MEFTREQLQILFSSPVYAIIIGLEVVLSNYKRNHIYTFKGTLYNVYLMLLNMGIDVLMLAFVVTLLNSIAAFSIFSIANPIVYWSVLVIAEDFLFYLLHLVDHKCRLFWAAHITHHSSTEYNLTVGFRSSVFQPLYRFLYFIPLALAGFKAIDIMFVYSATQIWGILIHTQYIKKLGFLELFMATPSHHRVHHASNAPYLDKNMGMVLIIWDRMFGTFQEELDERKVEYGLTKNLENPNPVNVVFHEWKAILSDLLKPVKLKHKLLYLLGPPGWSHDGSRKTSKQLEEEYYKGIK